MKKSEFEEHDRFTIDAELYFTGKRYRYDSRLMERRIKVVLGQIRLGIEVSPVFYVECSRPLRYVYPPKTIFRLDVKVCKKSNKTAFYSYFDEYYLRSEYQRLESIQEYETNEFRWRIFE